MEKVDSDFLPAGHGHFYGLTQSSTGSAIFGEFIGGAHLKEFGQTSARCFSYSITLLGKYTASELIPRTYLIVVESLFPSNNYNNIERNL